MKICIQAADVTDSNSSSILLLETINVPDDIPYPGDDRGKITLVGLKLAIDWHLSQRNKT